MPAAGYPQVGPRKNPGVGRGSEGVQFLVAALNRDGIE